ncbi:macro domain protein [Vibrio phage 1.031.O._10N.261.46.F8]|nr:macro domain protein [Vibrio phage 1.031.O._10N.261.46.F8]
MPVVRIEGDMFMDSQAHAYINTVNLQGVTGCGIAEIMKRKFKYACQEYRDACHNGDITLGKIFDTHSYATGNPQTIVHFPTKQAWRNPSQLAWIEAGLISLREWLLRCEEGYILAMPLLGCKNGQLDRKDVDPLIDKYLGDISHVEVRLYHLV